jgi:tRNA pseudouridine synthase 10
MKIEEKAIEILKMPVCNSCLGRQYGNLLSGLSNEERGKIIREYVAMLLDSGESIDIDKNNFHGIKFRNIKIKTEKPEKCSVCKNFFRDELERLAKETVKKFRGIEFKTFLVGTILSNELQRAEEEIWSQAGIEFVEPIKAEINRELGKVIERISDKTFSSKNPDVTVLVNLQTGKIKANIRSLYVSGGYTKLVRGIPQTKWVCSSCGGKGCIACKGTGKLYKTSVQEIIEKPFLKAAKAKHSSFHGAGREDIDARNLDYRPFVIEILQPEKRKIDLKKIERQLSKNKKVKVRKLKFCEKELIEKLKKAKIDKTYEAEVEFISAIDKKKLKELKKLPSMEIHQQTPQRVVHRRADILRKRAVRSIVWKLKGKRKIVFKIRAESGLYIKELINGDEGRTEPNVAEVLNNKVKKINLDVIKIHTKGFT